MQVDTARRKQKYAKEAKSNGVIDRGGTDTGEKQGTTRVPMDWYL